MEFDVFVEGESLVCCVGVGFLVCGEIGYELGGVVFEVD